MINRNFKIFKLVVNCSLKNKEEVIQVKNKLSQILNVEKELFKSTFCKNTIEKFNIRRNQEIGLRAIFWTKMAKKIFDKIVTNNRHIRITTHNINLHNCTIGIKEYSHIEGVEYDPYVIAFGFNLNLVVAHEGYSKRFKKRSSSRIRWYPQKELIVDWLNSYIEKLQNEQTI